MVFPVLSLYLCCILELLKTNTQSHHGKPARPTTPCLFFGKPVCKWGTGATDVSWRDRFVGMMVGATGLQSADLPWAGSWL